MPPEICNFTFKIMNSIESQKGEIVMYQPDETIRLEVRVENETVWLNRQQIAALFSRDIKTIGKHINNALHEELDGEQVEYYNLDMIMSVGYRVKSKRGIQFRRWSNKVLKQYLLKGYAVSQRIEQLERRVTLTEEKIDFFVHKSLPPMEGIFYDGQIFDAYAQIVSLIKQAKHSIVLIDNYINIDTLTMLSNRDTNVSATIYTRQLNQQQQLDVQRHNQQYPPIAINTCQHNHDRFLIVDDVAYLFGASLKDAGKKLFAYIRMQETSPSELLNNIR